ncbi:MAG: helix-turn-helix domain-containing protein [Candidatus Woesearchaeota archaeon]
MIIERKITIIKARKKADLNINEELLWIGNSLGLFQKRDKDKSCYRIFLELIKNKRGVSSDELAYKLGLTRATIIHHLKNLMKAGIVVEESNKYFLRVDTLKGVVEELKRDIENILDDIEKIASHVDEVLSKERKL